MSNDITTRSFEARLPPSTDLSKQTNWPSYPRHPGRFLTGTRQSTFQPLLFNYSGISWKSSIVGRISGATRSQNPPINRPSARNGTKRDEAGRPSGERKGDGGGWWRGEQSYVMNTLYLRFQGMLAHAPMGWLHPVLYRDPPCLSLSLSLLHPSSTPRSS